MKIAIIGATGNVGSRLTDEALRRGHTVTALARQASKLPAREGVTARDVDVAETSALAHALRGSDVVISTVRFLQTSAAQIVAAVKAAGVERLLVVGGAGSLYVAP
ncbi:NAD(P)-dependent oxidoreductase, partial [Cupriavidus pauculus]